MSSSQEKPPFGHRDLIWTLVAIFLTLALVFAVFRLITAPARPLQIYTGTVVFERGEVSGENSVVSADDVKVVLMNANFNNQAVCLLSVRRKAEEEILKFSERPLWVKDGKLNFKVHTSCVLKAEGFVGES